MTQKSTIKTRTRIKREFAATEKARAVLAIWTERRKPVQVCRELSITAALLALWFMLPTGTDSLAGLAGALWLVVIAVALATASLRLGATRQPERSAS